VRVFEKSRIGEVEGYLRAAPESVSCRKELADLYAEDGQFDKAVAEYTKAIQFAPENKILYRKRGEAYQAIGETEKAETDFDEAKRLEQESDTR
jgi:tetratricopeptide (TPR) repeat protein